jgi:hypothetical protein
MIPWALPTGRSRRATRLSIDRDARSGWQAARRPPAPWAPPADAKGNGRTRTPAVQHRLAGGAVGSLLAACGADRDRCGGWRDRDDAGVARCAAPRLQLPRRRVLRRCGPAQRSAAGGSAPRRRPGHRTWLVDHPPVPRRDWRAADPAGVVRSRARSRSTVAAADRSQRRAVGGVDRTGWLDRPGERPPAVWRCLRVLDRRALLATGGAADAADRLRRRGRRCLQCLVRRHAVRSRAVPRLDHAARGRARVRHRRDRNGSRMDHAADPHDLPPAPARLPVDVAARVGAAGRPGDRHRGRRLGQIHRLGKRPTAARPSAVVAPACHVHSARAPGDPIPPALGNGRDLAQFAFTGTATIGTLPALALLKPLVTKLCLRSGAIGGLFIPTLSPPAPCSARSSAMPGHTCGRDRRWPATR